MAPKCVYCTKYRTMLATASLAGMDHYIGVCLDQREPPKNGAGKNVKKAEGIQPDGVCAPWHGGNTLFCVALPVATVA